MLDLILHNLPNVLKVSYFIWATIGVLVGLLLGALPGLSGSVAVALLLPLTGILEPLAALSLFMGIYKGGLTGGAVSAIAFGIPGASESVPTIADGYALAKQGKSRKAISMAFWASTCGDLFSNLLTLFLILPLAGLALTIGPREMFWILFAALFLIGGFTTRSPIKALGAALLGLVLGMVGADPIMGVSRLTLGIYDLQNGISIGPLLIGVFAMSEVVKQVRLSVEKRGNASPMHDYVAGGKKGEPLRIVELLRSWRAIVVGCVIGTFVGILPGPGATIASFISYVAAKKASRHPEQFGQGSLEGVAAPEAGNNATCGPNFIPLLVFGIPGSAMAALFAGAFMLMGITPEPLMIQSHPDIMVSFLLILLLINPIVLVLGLYSAPLFARASALDSRLLYGFIFLLCILGSYGIRNSAFDVWVMLAAGVLGYFLERHNMPRSALLLGFIIAPMLEGALRRSIILSLGDPVYFLSSPVSVAMALILVAALVLPITTRFARRNRHNNAGALRANTDA